MSQIDTRVRWYHHLAWWTLPPAVMLSLALLGTAAPKKASFIVHGEQDGYTLLRPLYTPSLMVVPVGEGQKQLDAGAMRFKCEPSLIDEDPALNHEQLRLLLSCEGGAMFVVRGIAFEEEK